MPVLESLLNARCIPKIVPSKPKMGASVIKTPRIIPTKSIFGVFFIVGMLPLTVLPARS